MASFDEMENAIYVQAPDGKRYAFQAQKRNPNRGYVTVLCNDGKRRNVTGYKVESNFFVDPRGKNAKAFDPPPKPEDYKVQKLGPPSAEDIAKLIHRPSD